MSARTGGLRRIRIGSREVYAQGLEPALFGDLYHNAMTVSWPAFVGLAAAIFVVINALFAGVYSLGTQPLSDSDSFLKNFYFSIETLATVGYGDIHPQTNYGHVVASVETFVGLFLTAVLTGLIFARFSRPRARFIFAQTIVVTRHEGEPVLSVRLANGRLSLISGATAKLWITRTRTSAEGVLFRGFEELPLERAENPFFALSWTLFHRLDAQSPIRDLTSAQLEAIEAQFLVAVTGHDDTAAQSVYARKTYSPGDLRWNHRYVDIIKRDDEGRSFIDYRLIHDTEPLAADADLKRQIEPASESNVA